MFQWIWVVFLQEPIYCSELTLCSINRTLNVCTKMPFLLYCNPLEKTLIFHSQFVIFFCAKLPNSGPEHNSNAFCCLRLYCHVIYTRCVLFFKIQNIYWCGYTFAPVLTTFVIYQCLFLIIFPFTLLTNVCVIGKGVFIFQSCNGNEWDASADLWV